MLEELRGIASEDPAAASAVQVVRAVRQNLEEQWMPLIDRALRTDAMRTWSSAGPAAGATPLGLRSAPAGRQPTDDEVVAELDAAVDAVLDDGATAAEWERLGAALGDLVSRARQPAFVEWLREEHGADAFDRLVLAMDKAHMEPGVVAPPSHVWWGAANALALASRQDPHLRARIIELGEDFSVLGRLGELADIDSRRHVRVSSPDELMSAADAAGLGVDFVEEALKKFERSKLDVAVVTVGSEEVFVVTDGRTTGAFTTSGSGTLVYADEVSTDLQRLAGELGKVADVAGKALDGVAVVQAFGEGWARAEGEPTPTRIIEGTAAAIPVAVGAAVDAAAFAGGAAACGVIPGLTLISPLCGVAAVVGTKVAADVLTNEGADASFCDGDVFDQEEADSMGFHHTSEEVTGCD